ncbi:MAG: cation:proton antiporter [bacterium]|nr:cation:proton antiporter [bacterium]
MAILDSLPIVLAAGVVPQFLTEIVTVIVAGALIAYISFRLRLVPIIGFLIAGVMIGPNAFGLVRDQALVDATAEIGVILLLFTIGIEFSLEKLARIQRLIFGGGTMQVVGAIVLTMLVMLAFGVDWRSGIFTGMLVALSSTAIVLKLLGDKSETNAEHGQVSLGLLIFQDLAIVVMVLLIPVLSPNGGGGAGEIGLALAKAAGIIAIVLLLARRIMPKVLENVARTCSPELFLLTVIAICFGTAYLTNLAGVSLSLGAFLAGLMVSESRFSQHALSETLPLQILFSATFFVSVGMLLDLSFLVQHLPIIVAAIATVLVIKIATAWAAVKVLGYATPVAAASALALAQIGEFSFVLERAGREVGLFPAGASSSGSQTFIAATVVLMVATPFLMNFGSGLAAKIVRKRETAGMPADDNGESLGESLALEDHVIVAGYGDAARCLVRVLAGSGIPYIITTLSPEGANEADADGLPVVRGDATKPYLLRHVGAENAKMMVIADDNPAMAHRITSVARQLNPTMRIVVRTRYTEEVAELSAAGADTVIAEELESIVQLFGEVLRDYRIPADQIDAYEEMARSNGYAELLDGELDIDNSIFRCEPDKDCFDSRLVKVRPGSPIEGNTASSLLLMKDFGLTLRSLRRNGQGIDPVPSNIIFAAGDELELSGETSAFAQNATLFRAPTGVGGAATKDNASEKTLMDFNDETGLDLETEVTYTPTAGPDVCSHLGRIRSVLPSVPGCEECLRSGDEWVHLRICLVCGHVGCCDTSKNQHATAHFHDTDHPVMKSIETFEDWAWCFVDEEYI